MKKYKVKSVNGNITATVIANSVHLQESSIVFVVDVDFKRPVAIFPSKKFYIIKDEE